MVSVTLMPGLLCFFYFRNICTVKEADQNRRKWEQSKEINRAWIWAIEYRRGVEWKWSEKKNLKPCSLLTATVSITVCQQLLYVNITKLIAK